MLLLLLGALALVAAAARWSAEIPGAPVPQSAQTLAVLLVGGALGPVLGPLALVLYVVVGALGAPVFADGAAGLEVVVGPSAGYLLGFVVAAWWMGRCSVSTARWSGRRLLVLLGAAVLAHVLILGLGAGRLALDLGPAGAVEAGVTPFLLGGAVKSLLAALLLWPLGRERPRAGECDRAEPG